jgi:hypothetical protein
MCFTEIRGGCEMSRIHVNLRRLPKWAVTLIALTVVIAITLAAWHVGKDEPNPEWVTKKLNPVLGWLWLMLAVIALFYKLSNWKKKKQNRDK